MEKNKNKKKLFAIIGGSVLAFVLTIALSVSITLAYFGDTANGGATIKMSGDVTIGATMAENATLNHVLPGETISVSGKVTVASSGTTADGSYESVAITKAFVRAKLTNAALEDFFTEVTDGVTVVVDNSSEAISGAKWAVVGDYIYLVASADAETATTATNLFLVNSTNAGVDVTFAFSGTVNPLLDNSWAGSEVEITLNFTAIQGELPVDGTMTSTVTIAQAQDAFAAVEGSSQIEKPAPTPEG